MSRIVITAAVDDWLWIDPSQRREFMFKCLARHSAGDWGDVDAQDTATNNENQRFGGRLVSVYPLPFGLLAEDDSVLWVITDAGGNPTTILFPSDY